LISSISMRTLSTTPKKSSLAVIGVPYWLARTPAQGYYRPQITALRLAISGQKPADLCQSLWLPAAFTVSSYKALWLRSKKSR
jgi:hypothetical protein